MQSQEENIRSPKILAHETPTFKQIQDFLNDSSDNSQEEVEIIETQEIPRGIFTESKVGSMGLALSEIPEAKIHHDSSKKKVPILRFGTHPEFGVGTEQRLY